MFRMKNFREISAEELICSPFKLIGKDWLMICAADNTKASGANMMTASWGGLGILWNKPVATVYIRPQRYSYSLVEGLDRISLCFTGSQLRDALAFCGSKSGRDFDKPAHLGLDIGFDGDVPFVEQSEIVMICKKAYADDLKKSNFVDTAHLKNYPHDDFHRFYILEIEKVLIKD